MQSLNLAGTNDRRGPFLRRDMAHFYSAIDGRDPTTRPLQHYGLRELAELGESVSIMAATLSQRSQEIFKVDTMAPAVGIYANGLKYVRLNPVPS